jgi:plasmid maintenance system antidote protein VapI
MDQPIEPSPGYRLLEKAEIIQKDDQFRTFGGWQDVHAAVGSPVMNGIFQRKIPDAPAERPGLEAKFNQITKELERALEQRMQTLEELDRLMEKDQEFVREQQARDKRMDALEKGLNRLVIDRDKLVTECAQLKHRLGATEEAWSNDRKHFSVRTKELENTISQLQLSRTRRQERQMTLIQENAALTKANSNLKLDCDATHERANALWKAGQASEAKVRELVAEGAGWTKFSDRRPTIEDADINGMVMCMAVDGGLFTSHVNSTFGLVSAMWRPTNSPLPVSPFVKWKRSLTEDQIHDFGGPGSLDAIWGSLRDFNPKVQ